MKRQFLARTAVLIMTTVLILSMTACGKTGQNSGYDTNSQVEYVIRLGHSDTEDNLINTSLTNYAEWVNKQTEGRVVIRLYPEEKLGDNTEMAQQLVTGELDAMMMPQGVEAS